MLYTAGALFGYLPHEFAWPFANYFPTWEVISGWISLLAFMLVLSALTLFTAWAEQADEITRQALEFAGDNLKWIDVYASMDPVPNGSLFKPDALSPESSLTSIEVCNELSLLRDHTSYVGNEDEFIPLVINAIAQYSRTRLYLAAQPLQAFISRFRRIRVSSKGLDSLILTASLVIILPNLEFVKYAGTHLNELTKALCNFAGLGSCWEWPAIASGLVGILAVYIVSQMCVQYVAYLCDYCISHLPFKISFWCGFLTTLFRHSIACTALYGVCCNIN
jgi:hypothetical protein